MKHLTDVEFVDLLEGRLVGGRREHAESCDVCRAQTEMLRAALLQTAFDEVPEPSPLFWDSFSTRVAEAVRAERRPWRPAWLSWTFVPAVRWSGAMAALALLAGVAWSVLTPRESGPPRAPIAPTRAAGAPVSGNADIWFGDLESDEQWAVVRTAADGLDWEDVHAAGITPTPGSAERVAMELTPEERSVLARLIEDELRRTGL